LKPLPDPECKEKASGTHIHSTLVFYAFLFPSV
jgi:hypothetical protein